MISAHTRSATSVLLDHEVGLRGGVKKAVGASEDVLLVLERDRSAFGYM